MRTQGSIYNNNKGLVAVFYPMLYSLRSFAPGGSTPVTFLSLAHDRCVLSFIGDKSHIISRSSHENN